MKYALLAIVTVACGNASSDIPQRQPPKPDEPPPKPERKEILPAQGMVCQVIGSGDHAWWPDGRMTKLEDRMRTFTSRDGTVYSYNYATKGLAPVDQKGPDATRVIAKGLADFTGMTIDSPTKMVAWEHGDKELLHELVGGSWKAGTLPARPADDTYSLQAVTYGPGDTLWVLRTTGLFVRGADGYEEIALGGKDGYERKLALATTPSAVYVLTGTRLLRVDAARKVTAVASWDEGSLNDGALAVTKAGRVIAYANRYRSSFVLTLGDTDAKATRIELGDAKSLLAVDAAGRTWVRRAADIVVIEADNTQQVYAPGSLPLFPSDEKAGCTPLGGGFAKLPAAGKHTGTLQLKFSGAANGGLELCARPDGGRSPSPCDGAAERIVDKLDQHGMRRLVVPTGRWEAAVQLDGTWYVKDFSRTGYNTTNTNCDITAGETCTIEMNVQR